MAQAQYRRAAKPGGFQPINVGGQSIARMREESARVAEGLRTARAAEIQNREAVLAQMKEDARYTERAQAANAKILPIIATCEAPFTFPPAIFLSHFPVPQLPAPIIVCKDGNFQ